MSVAPDTSNAPPRPDADAALLALNLLLPRGPGEFWALYSHDGEHMRVWNLHPERHGDGGGAELRRWLDRENRELKRNCYFALCAAQFAPLEKKAAKGDVADARLMWVDCDPEGKRDLASEREVIFGRLTQPHSAAPPPSHIIDSGRGYWAIWRLTSPVPLTTAEIRKDYEDRLLRLKRIFAGDDCANLDRICRLPGSVNWPNAQKRAQGCAPRLAALIEGGGGATYRLDDFGLPPSTVVAHPAASASEVTVDTSSLRRLVDVDELDAWNVGDRVKVIILQGSDPDRPKTRDNSRSAWLFDACCQLVRSGVPDEVIYSVITDPDFEISASVLDKGSSAHNYALKQIRDAKDDAVDPALRRLNAEHAVIGCEGGKTRVMCWSRGDDGRSFMALQSFADFRNRYMNQQVVVATDADGKVHTRPMGDWWLKHPRRRQYEGIVFVPGEGEEVDGYYNLWRGWGVEPKPGSWALLRAHVEQVLASGNADYAAYILRFAAWAVQNPGTPAEVALVLRGAKGTGKGLFARTLKELFGRHGMQINSRRHLSGNFNAHLRDVCLLFADEAFASREREDEAVLKGLITEPTLIVEGKGKDAFAAPNRLHILMSSDQDWVAPAGPGERRFAVFDVSDAHKEDRGWFAPIMAELDNGGREALLHDLLATDLGGWHPREDVPQTAGLQRQKELGLPPLYQWLLTLITDGELPKARHDRPDRALAADLIEHARESVPELRHESSNRIGRELADWGCTKIHTGYARGWQFPPLGDLRARWVQRVGAWSWGDDPPSTWGAGSGGHHGTPF